MGEDGEKMGEDGEKMGDEKMGGGGDEKMGDGGSVWISSGESGRDYSGIFADYGGAGENRPY